MEPRRTLDNGADSIRSRCEDDVDPSCPGTPHASRILRAHGVMVAVLFPQNPGAVSSDGAHAGFPALRRPVLRAGRTRRVAALTSPAATARTRIVPSAEETA